MGKGSKGVQETAAEKAAAEIAIDQYNTYMQRYRPFEKKFIADVIQPTSPREAIETGKANADLAQKMSLPTGVDPHRFKTSRDFSSGAKVVARAMNDTTQAVRDKKVAAMQAISDMGMGKQSSANLGYGALAQDSVRTAISEAGNKQAVSNSITSGVAGAVGTGAAIYANTRGGSADGVHALDKSAWEVG